jgi:hypothetical protein
MSNIWRPHTQVENNRVLDLSRGNQATWEYSLSGTKVFPAGTTAWMQLFNTRGQTVATWEGVVSGGTITFDEPASNVDSIVRGNSWQLFAEIDGVTRLLSQGTVIRTEAPYPDAPAQSPEYDGVRYQYSFGTPGLLRDPAWRVLKGLPRVYDNSGRSLPNAVAAGSLAGGDLTVFGQCAMLWYAPLRTDAVRLTYNTIRNHENSNGELWVVICSDYSMTNWVGFYHKQVWGVGSWDNDTLQIVTGSGPTTFTNRVSVAGDTANNSYYTAEYNPLTNTYTLWNGTTQKCQWTDSTNIINHGPGERYVGFGFKGALLNSGVQVSDWLIGDAP